MKRTSALLLAVCSIAFIYYFGTAFEYSSLVAWIVFLPLELLRKITIFIGLKEDFRIIYLLLIGIPLLIFYWFSVGKFISKVFEMIEEKLNQ